MRVTLIPFDSNCSSQVEGQFKETAEHLKIKWTLQDHEEVFIPPHSEQNRVTGLWESTCFEFFLKNIETGRYLEFNFSPSTDWNAFQFQGYRGQMENLDTPAPAMNFDGTSFEAHILKAFLPEEFNRPGIRSHWMTTVLKFNDGTLHYLAPSHPDETPDFHQFNDQFTF